MIIFSHLAPFFKIHGLLFRFRTAQRLRIILMINIMLLVTKQWRSTIVWYRAELIILYKFCHRCWICFCKLLIIRIKSVIMCIITLAIHAVVFKLLSKIDWVFSELTFHLNEGLRCFRTHGPHHVLITWGRPWRCFVFWRVCWVDVLNKNRRWRSCELRARFINLLN